MSRLTKSCYAHEQNDIRVTFDEKYSLFGGIEHKITILFADISFFCIFGGAKGISFLNINSSNWRLHTAKTHVIKSFKSLSKKIIVWLIWLIHF